MMFSKKGKKYFNFRKKFYESSQQKNLHSILNIKNKVEGLTLEEINESRKNLNLNIQSKMEKL